MSTVIHLCGKVIASVFSSCKILPAPVEKRGLREGWEDNPTPWRNLLGAGGGWQGSFLALIRGCRLLSLQQAHPSVPTCR